MALQPAGLSQTSRERVDKLFDDIQNQLDKQRKLLLEQIHDGTNLIINQQKYNNIINNLKDIATIAPDNKPITPDQKIKDVTQNEFEQQMDQSMI